MPSTRTSLSRLACLAPLALVAVSMFANPAGAQVLQGVGATARAADSSELAAVTDSLAGKSGKLKMRLFGAHRGLQIGILQRLFGEKAVATPGIHPMQDTSVASPVKLITLLPFSEKAGGKIGDYRVGYWPAEKKRVRGPAYVNPEGFIEVTLDNVDQPVSEHFRLGDFVTHNQADVWPKYIVLREELVDKLELVLADLESHGIKTTNVKVMSGFRTPEYNQQGVGPRRGGRARDSRHQFGDAADIIIDSDGDGRMDDLNHDHKVNAKDNKIILDAVDRVERAHADLVGGFGVYKATRQHGPFVHIDVRGNAARWTGAEPRRTSTKKKTPAKGTSTPAVKKSAIAAKPAVSSSSARTRSTR